MAAIKITIKSITNPSTADLFLENLFQIDTAQGLSQTRETDLGFPYVDSQAGPVREGRPSWLHRRVSAPTRSSTA